MKVIIQRNLDYGIVEPRIVQVSFSYIRGLYERRIRQAREENVEGLSTTSQIGSQRHFNKGKYAPRFRPARRYKLVHTCSSARS